MADERRSRILAKLREATAPPDAMQLCRVSAEVTEATGAGIMLMSGDLPLGSPCSSNQVSALLERLQFDLGEGPCVDAYQLGSPVMEPDLADPAVTRWHEFSGQALDVGVRAVFGFPLEVGAVRIGALNLYRDHAGPMSDEHHAEAIVMAEVAAQALLAMQAAAPDGQLAAEMEEAGDFPYVVHQASGMVAAQLEVSVAQALIRLRAHAFGNDRRLADVAADVVARRIRFVDLNGEVAEQDGEP